MANSTWALASIATSVVLSALLSGLPSGAAPSPQPGPKPPAVPPGMMVLPIKLPPPPFYSGPMPMPPVPGQGRKPRGPFLVPVGTKLLSLGKPVTSSDERPAVGTLSVVTDGEKSALAGNWVELAAGLQWVQIDLKQAYNLYAIVVWHYHGEARIYNDVIVQLADDANFTTNVRTVFNTDQSNRSGLGVGHDHMYFESYEGKLIPVAGLKARCVRLYSNGNSSDDQNHYTEVEVWGKEAPRPRSISSDMMVLPLKLPPPSVSFTRNSVPRGTVADPKGLSQHSGPFLVPKGTGLLSLGKPVTSSDDRPNIGTLDMVTDGKKKSDDGYWIELAAGKQWVQIDLQQTYNIYAIVVWHYWNEPRVYKDVRVQVSNDPQFIVNVRTLFDDTVTGGPGHHKYGDRPYFESHEGKLIPGNGVKARYVRLYSNGNSPDDQNHYTEVEVWGK